MSSREHLGVSDAFSCPRFLYHVYSKIEKLVDKWYGHSLIWLTPIFRQDLLIDLALLHYKIPGSIKKYFFQSVRFYGLYWRFAFFFASKRTAVLTSKENALKN